MTDFGKLPISSIRWKQHKKQILTIVIVVILAVMWFAGSEQMKREDGQKPAVISAIQQRYQPSPRWLSLNPDTQHGDWSALKDPVECTYRHPERKNCWKVIYTVNVMPGAEKKEITCEWLVNMDDMQTQALNTEASTLFYQR